MNEKSAQIIVESIIENAPDSNSLVICVGAGLSALAGVPTWADLAPTLSKRLRKTPAQHSTTEIEEFTKRASPSDVAEFFEKEYGRFELVSEIRNAMTHGRARPTPIHLSLARLPLKGIVTTNYDKLIEESLELEKKNFRVVVQSADATFSSSEPLAVFKLNGTIEQPETIALTQSDYANSLHSNEAIRTSLRALFATNLIVFVGYSPNDLEFDQLYRLFKGSSRSYEQYDTQSSNWIVLTPDTNRLTVDLWLARGVRVEKVQYSELVEIFDSIHKRYGSKRNTISRIAPKNQVLISAQRDAEDLVRYLKQILQRAGSDLVQLTDVPSGGRTILEKFEQSVNESKGAIVVLSSRGRPDNSYRSRENISFELGYLVGVLGRKRVLVLVTQGAEVPPEVSGTYYLIVDPLDPGEIFDSVLTWLDELG